MPQIFIILPVYGENEPVNYMLNEISNQQINDYDVNVYFIYTPSSKASKLVYDQNLTKSININIETVYDRGYGNAYKHALKLLKTLRLSDNDIVITGDCDGTYNFRELNEIIHNYNIKNCDFLNIGRLAQRKSNSFSKINLIGNYLLTFFINIIFLTKIKDSQSGQWVFNRKFIDAYSYDELYNGMEFSSIIKIIAYKSAKISFNQMNMPYFQRMGSPSTLHWFKDGFRIFNKLLKFRIFDINRYL